MRVACLARGVGTASLAGGHRDPSGSAARGGPWQARRFRAHPLVADRFLEALTRVGDTYSEQELTDLGLRRFMGVYMHRTTTMGSSWSKHAFGIAMDLDATHTAEHTPWSEARFSKPEYNPLHEAFEDHWQGCHALRDYERSRAVALIA